MKKTIPSAIITSLLLLGTCMAQVMPVDDQTISDFDVKNAASNMQELQSSVDTLTTQLNNMDAKEIGS